MSIEIILARALDVLEFVSPPLGPDTRCLLTEITDAGSQAREAEYDSHSQPIKCPKYVTTLLSDAADATVERAHETQPIADLIRALRNHFDDIPWRGTSRVPGAAFTRLVGPGTHFPHPHMRLGLYALPSDYDYAPHQHLADEIYVVLAGHAAWSLHAAPSVEQRSGSIIQIPSLTPHSMHTSKSAMLALWTWTGDIGFESYQYLTARTCD